MFVYIVASQSKKMKKKNRKKIDLEKNQQGQKKE